MPFAGVGFTDCTCLAKDVNQQCPAGTCDCWKFRLVPPHSICIIIYMLISSYTPQRLLVQAHNQAELRGMSVRIEQLCHPVRRRKRRVCTVLLRFSLPFFFFHVLAQGKLPVFAQVLYHLRPRAQRESLHWCLLFGVMFLHTSDNSKKLKGLCLH